MNILTELHDDIGAPVPSHGSLEHWARQGVLLLNASLTVRARQAASHQRKGWETFTDEVIRVVNHKDARVVFILWGGSARRKRSLVDTSRHVIIESAHPSPLSASGGFFGSRPLQPGQRGPRRGGARAGGLGDPRALVTRALVLSGAARRSSHALAQRKRSRYRPSRTFIDVIRARENGEFSP